MHRSIYIRAAAAAAILLLTSCSSVTSHVTEDLTGTWVQNIDGTEDDFQGIIFNRLGGAGSLNMGNLQYTSYVVSGETLILKGVKKGGENVSDPVTEVFTIESLTLGGLVLNDGVRRLVYKKLLVSSEFDAMSTPLGSVRDEKGFAAIEDKKVDDISEVSGSQASL